MAQVCSFRNYGVYVVQEAGSPHHRPHAHIKNKGRRVASVFLETLEVFFELEPLPKGLLALLAVEQPRLLDKWTELNEQ